jgi:putative acetyltransferase
MVFEVTEGELDHPEVQALLRHHLETIEPTAPKESRHALDLAGLKQPSIRFFALWADSRLAGIAALKQLSSQAGELKSMRTADGFLRSGVATHLLSYLEQQARASGHQALFLETGAMAFFDAAHAFYRHHGFEPCGPFAEYVPDRNSVFMCKRLVP